MAKTKNLSFPDLLRHWQNVKAVLEEHEKDAADQKEQAEDKLLKLKSLNGKPN